MIYKSYILFLYLCCQSPAERQDICVQSPEAAAVIMWEKNQDGHCYEGKLLEYTHHGPGEDYPEIREIPIPKVSFQK